MKTAKTTFVLVAMAALAAAAGGVVGRLSSGKATAGAKSGAAVQRANLSEELRLTPDQREKMKQVWENVQAKVRRYAQESADVQRTREDALVALMTPEQKAQYQKLTADSNQKLKELEERRKSAFNEAVSETHALLNESQRQTYDQIIKSRVGSAPDPASPAPAPWEGAAAQDAGAGR